MLFDSLTDEWKAMPSETAFYFRDLADHETHTYNENESFDAASVIKLPVMAAIYHAVKEGRISLSQTLTVRDCDKVPSCGSVKYLPEGTLLPVSTLLSLMISISDNTATNMLVRLISMEYINAYLASLGMETTRINRLIFDDEASKRGISNRIALCDIAKLLEMIHSGTLVDAPSSAAMKEILLAQQIKHKIPNALPHIPVAHKTGEDTGESHDVAIVYAEHPYILCFASAHTDVYAYECAMREASRRIYVYMQEKYRI